MYKRLLLAVLFGILASEPVSAQEPGMQLKGVLISKFQRTALVNGMPVQEGDRVAGVEILAIEQHGIRVLAGTREITVDVGGIIAADLSSEKVVRLARVDAHDQHAVRSGETLSDIALRYRKGGVSLNQMMIALYRSNPQAFSNNINILHAGAILRIPDEGELVRQTVETATAEVMRHRDRWLSADHQPARIADSLALEEYGPVKRGETLAGIAASLLQDDITVDQMMIALFQSNPQAFSDNINVLHAGAVLRIPDESEVHSLTHKTAAAEVVRHVNQWRAAETGYPQLAMALSGS